MANWYVLSDSPNIDTLDNIGDAYTLADSTYVLKYDSINDVWRKALKGTGAGNYDTGWLMPGDVINLLGKTISTLNRDIILREFVGGNWVRYPLTSLFTLTNGSGKITNSTGSRTLQADLVADVATLMDFSLASESHTLIINGCVKGGTFYAARGIHCVSSGSISVGTYVQGGSNPDTDGIISTQTASITVGTYVTGGSNSTASGIKSYSNGLITVGTYVTGGSASGIYNMSGSGTCTIIVGTYVQGGTGSAITNLGSCSITVGTYVQGGTGSDACGIRHSGPGNIVVGSYVLGGTGSNGHGIYITSSCSASIGTYVQGGTGSSACGIKSTSTSAGNIIVDGNVQSGISSGAYGIDYTGSSLTIAGNLLLPTNPSTYCPSPIYISNNMNLYLTGGNNQYMEVYTNGSKVKYYPETREKIFSKGWW